MNCDEVQEYFDDIVDPGNQCGDRAVLDHIENCPVCKTELKKWEKIYFTLKNSPIPSPPEGLAEAIMAVTARSGAAESFPRSSQRLIAGYWITPVAALAAVLILGFVIRQYFSLLQPKPESSASVEERTLPLPVLEVSLYMPEAESVTLVGDFNQWNRRSHPLVRDSEGNWHISIKLNKGYFQYQLLVDGKNWMLDPNNPVIMADGFGGYNSGIYL